MDLQTLWIIILSISTPIAGVFGFAVQLREVKKSHLENEKLQLEIEELKAKAVAADRRIVQVTTEEVLKYDNNIKFSKISTRDAKSILLKTPLKERFRDFALAGSIILGFLFFTLYFLYDLYRLAIWLYAKF